MEIAVQIPSYTPLLLQNSGKLLGRLYVVVRAEIWDKLLSEDRLSEMLSHNRKCPIWLRHKPGSSIVLCNGSSTQTVKQINFSCRFEFACVSCASILCMCYFFISSETFIIDIYGSRMISLVSIIYCPPNTLEGQLKLQWGK